MRAKIHSGNAVGWAKEYSGPLFHALLCDAPYEMAFMGQDWDKSGVAFDPDTWESFARVLYPGAFLFVSAGTINDDLISVAMREAGLRKIHKVMGWAYGSGFPKASRVNHGSPKTETFSGHRYGLQALKPAIETILVFQKPYEGKPIDNITETGAGALNIDGGRIGTEEDINRGGFRERVRGFVGIKSEEMIPAQPSSPLGRWPSNFILLDPEAARALDEQSGELGLSKGGYRGSGERGRTSGNWGMGSDPDKTPTGFGDSGGASRFFFRVEEQIDEADPVFYSAKASRGEREGGLESFEAGPSGAMKGNRQKTTKRLAGDGRRNPEVKQVISANPHPTVKPLALCKYLATLLLPPAEYAPRRIFVPFAGVASEMIGAIQAGWEEIEGVELTEEYIPIAEARLAYWQKKPIGSRKPKSSIPPNVKDSNQLELI